MKGEALPESLSAGSVVDGRYQIEREIGRGGVGVVLEATHLQLKTKVALRALLGPTAPEQVAVDRLLQEVSSSSSLQSEHVVRVTDRGTLPGGFPYLVTEFLTGESLPDYLAERGTLPVNEALEILLQACEALAEAHMHRMVHRNLRPSNLFLARREDGSLLVKVLDFGIASYLTSGKVQLRLLASAAGLDVLHYLAPEQLLDLTRVDPRSDVWALGAIFYELLTGEPPFVGVSVAEIAFSISRDAYTPLAQLRPGLPPDLERVVARCLTKKPEDRIESVVALVKTLAPLAPEHLRSLVDRTCKMEPAHAAITIPAAASAPSGGDEAVLALYQAASGAIGASKMPSFVDGEEGDPDAHTRVQTRSEEMNALLQASLPSSRRQKILSARKARAAAALGETPAAGVPAAPAALVASSAPTDPPKAAVPEPPRALPEPPTPSGRQAPLPQTGSSSGRLWLLIPVLLLLGIGAVALRSVLAPSGPSPAVSAPR